MKQPNDSKCRMCCKADEHIKHVVAGLTTLVPSEYSKHMELQVTDKYYEYITEKVINVSGITIMWDVLVITVQTILAI